MATCWETRSWCSPSWMRMQPLGPSLCLQVCEQFTNKRCHQCDAEARSHHPLCSQAHGQTTSTLALCTRAGRTSLWRPLWSTFRYCKVQLVAVAALPDTHHSGPPLSLTTHSGVSQDRLHSATQRHQQPQRSWLCRQHWLPHAARQLARPLWRARGAST